jgi:hypothetical protein
MRRYDLGEPVTLRREVYDLDGELTDATVNLTVVKPEGGTYNATVTRTSLGIYDATVPASEVDEYGPYSGQWRTSGEFEDETEVRWYVADEGDDLPPLASVEQLGRKLGYTPEPGDGEYDRAASILDEASELIRDKAGKTWTTSTGALEPIPSRVRVICIAAAYRAFTNPEALSQRSIGDSSKSFDRTGREGGEAVYLTDDEVRRVRKAAGASSFNSVTLVSPYGGTPADPWEQVLAE